jgi:hypothetical protein
MLLAALICLGWLGRPVSPHLSADRLDVEFGQSAYCLRSSFTLDAQLQIPLSLEKQSAVQFAEPGQALLYHLPIGTSRIDLTFDLNCPFPLAFKVSREPRPIGPTSNCVLNVNATAIGIRDFLGPDPPGSFEFETKLTEYRRYARSFLRQSLTFGGPTDWASPKAILVYCPFTHEGLDSYSFYANVSNYFTSETYVLEPDSNHFINFNFTYSLFPDKLSILQFAVEFFSGSLTIQSTESLWVSLDILNFMGEVETHNLTSGHPIEVASQKNLTIKARNGRPIAVPLTISIVGTGLKYGQPRVTEPEDDSLGTMDLIIFSIVYVLCPTIAVVFIIWCVLQEIRRRLEVQDEVGMEEGMQGLRPVNQKRSAQQSKGMVAFMEAGSVREGNYRPVTQFKNSELLDASTSNINQMVSMLENSNLTDSRRTSRAPGNDDLSMGI